MYQPLFTAFGPSAIEQRVTATGGSNAKLIVTDAANRPKLDEVAGCPPVLLIYHGTPGAAAFALALADQPAEFAPTMRRGTDPFILIFTSGTTGHAKGVAAPLSALLQFAVFMTRSGRRRRRVRASGVSVCLPASVRLLIPLGAELVSELPRLGISALPVAAFELAEQIALAELIARRQSRRSEGSARSAGRGYPRSGVMLPPHSTRGL